jgi:hypothetical protein
VLLSRASRKTGRSWSARRTEESPLEVEERDLPDRSLKNIGEVSDLLEETINRVRLGPFDLRAANSIGFLAGILLKALDQRLEDRLAHLEAVMLPSKRGTTDTEAFEFRSIKEI